MAFCTNCGAKIPEATKFCPECGTRIAQAEASVPVVEEPIPAPVVEEPASVAEEPALVVEEPIPAPAAEEPVPAVEEPAPAVEEQPGPAPAAPAAVKFEVGEDGLEYVPYVPVAAPVAAPAAVSKAPAEPAPAAEAAPKAAAAPAAPAPKKAKEPKKGIAKFLPFILIGAAALLALFIGAIVLVVSLVKGMGGAEVQVDPVLGVYDAVYAEMMGYEIVVQDIWADGVTIELKEKGKCVIELDGKESKGKWTLEDDGTFTVKGGKLDCSGTLEEGEMTLEDVMDMGVELTLLKEGYEYPEIEAPEDPGDPGVIADEGPLTEMQEKWNGTWYGVINFMECTGKYSEYDYMQYDAYMTVKLEEDGKGTMKLWTDPNLPAFAEATVEAYEDMLFTMEGSLLDGEMDCNNWMFVPATDGTDRYVMPYDRIDDDDGDMYEYVIYMKKWGASWQDEMNNGEVTPPYVEAYEEYIAGGMQAPALDDGAPLAASLEEAIAGNPYVPQASVTTEIGVPSNWYGWVYFMNWWGNDEPDQLIDAWATVGANADGKLYCEVYVDDQDMAFYSVYMDLEYDNTTIVPVVSGSDSWVGDTYIPVGDEDLYRLGLMADGTLVADFAFESYTGDFGCDVVMCFREHGQLWDEYEDLLPPRYDEYLEVLAEEAAQGSQSAAQAPAVGGDGILSFDELKAAFDWLYDNGSGSTLEQIEAQFGVPGELDSNEADFRSYRWKTEDGSEKVLVSFVLKDDGTWKYSGMSWSDGLK